MHSPASVDRCFTFINCQLAPPDRPAHHPEQPLGIRTVTISRQAGSGAHSIAGKVTELLQAEAPWPSCPWTIFDRNLVERVLEDHKLPSRLARFMREDTISEISDIMDELFGLHPSSWTLAHKTAETILHLAELGGVILIGRGAALVTARLNYVMHVRIVGSLERRLARLEETCKMDRRAAADFIHREDEGRKRFLRQYFDHDIDDPLLYHLTINTDLVTIDEAAHLIAHEVLRSRSHPSLFAARKPEPTLVPVEKS